MTGPIARAIIESWRHFDADPVAPLEAMIWRAGLRGMPFITTLRRLQAQRPVIA